MAFCTNCGKNLPEGAAFCTECGTPAANAFAAEDFVADDVVPVIAPPAEVVAEQPAAEPSVAESVPEVAVEPEGAAVPTEPVVPAEPAEAPVYTQPQITVETPVYVQPAVEDAPPPKGKYSVVSTAGFFWMSVLFSIPVIGFIAYVIMSFAPKNENIKHFARANLIAAFVSLVVTILLVIAIFVLLNVLQSELEQFVMDNSYEIEAAIEEYVYEHFADFAEYL